MRNLIYLLVISIVISISGCSNKSKKVSSQYSDLQWGEYLLYYNKTDSAFLMFNKAANNSTDSIEKGKAYRYMGVMQRKFGDLYGAQESLTNGLKILDERKAEHRDLIATIYNTLGNVSLDLKKYNEAIDFYNNALKITTKKDYVLEVLNGKATAFQKRGNYTDAIAIYDSILSLNPADVILTARILSNRAKTKWLRDANYPALNEYWSALKIRTDSQDNWGLNASYAHLSDYYSAIRTDSALYYAQKMNENARRIKSPDDILEAVDKLIRLNSSPAQKEHLYEEFKKLNDSIQLARDTVKSQFALIRYDVQKSKADNLTLQQHITKQRFVTYGIVLIACALLAGLLLWFRSRRKKLRQESENAIRESQLKTSQKVHDVVANGLYRIMNELEHGKTINREPLLDKIEELYEQSRDISYEHIPDNPTDHDKQIHRLLTSFANEHTKVIVIGNQQDFWSRVSASQKHEVQIVLEEIMINMQKHSHAKNVVIHFKQENDASLITYKDDGIGFAKDIKFGNGLNNTVSRIKTLGAEISFEKGSGDGVSISIRFPWKHLQS